MCQQEAETATAGDDGSFVSLTQRGWSNLLCLSLREGGQKDTVQENLRSLPQWVLDHSFSLNCSYF